MASSALSTDWWNHEKLVATLRRGVKKMGLTQRRYGATNNKKIS
jgi:hypothetical protein